MMKFHNFQLSVSCIAFQKNKVLRPDRFPKPVRSLYQNIYLKSCNVLFFSILASLAYAEVTLDGTLGFGGALEGPHYQIGAELGQQHGGNLFQSFSHFNINTGESATFSGPHNVHNIISRVTGGNPSHINGLLRSTIPNADMYFLNPYGIMFGEGASLDVQGSFHASTADTLRLSDGGEFNVRYPNNSSLTVAPVEAFGFLTDTPAAITVQDTELSVSEGKTLSLIGGDLRMNGEPPVYDDGVTFNTELSAEFGRINLASVASRGEVVVSNQFGLKLSAEAQRGLITINNTKVSTSGEGGGAVYIRGGRFELYNSRVETHSLGAADGIGIDIETDELTVMKGRLSSRVFESGHGGDIKINVADSIVIGGEEDEAGVPTLIITGAGKFENSGKVGDIVLQAKQLFLQDGAIINTLTRGTGKSGNVKIQVSGLVSMSGTVEKFYSGILTSSAVEGNNTGDAGNILLEAGELRLEDGIKIGTSTFGSGRGGNITMLVNGPIHISGKDFDGLGTLISSDSNSRAKNAGDCGTITVKAEQLYLNDGGQIHASNLGGGQGGDIYIKVAKEIILSGKDKDRRNGMEYYSGISTETESDAEYAGDAGNLILEVGNLILKEGTEISAGTSGPGHSSTIEIRANSVTLSGNSSGIFTSSIARTNNTGNAGDIILEAKELKIENGALISTVTFGSGQGGDIKIMVSGPVTLSGKGNNGVSSSLAAITFGINENAGKGGTIELTAGQLFLDNSAEITSESIGYEESGSLGQGDAGDVVINVKDKLIMQNSFIKTSADKAEGGNIHITSPGYLSLIHSGIITSVFAEKGDGGNITLAPQFIVLDNSKIIAQAYEGRGGNIDITTTGIYNNTIQGIFESPLRRAINASSQLGIDGEIQINTPEINVMEGLFTLPINFLDTSQLFKEGCTPRTIANTFLNKGHHKVALKNLSETPWTSFFLEGKRPQDTEKKRIESNLFDGNFSLTKPLFGCGHGD